MCLIELVIKLTSGRKISNLVTELIYFILLRLLVAGPPQRVLSSFLHSFVNSSHGGIPFRPASLPALGLSQGDKQCIRDRSSIMARHLFADMSEDFINSQVWCAFHFRIFLMCASIYYTYNSLFQCSVW